MTPKDLQREELYFKMLDEVLDYAIILLDTDGIIRNWNKGAQKIKQYDEKEAVGQHFSLFYLPEDRSNGLPSQLLERAAAEGRAVHEGWRVRKDGTRFWGSVTLTALHGADNAVIGFSKVTRDLTERKTAEDQLKQYAEELQQKNEALQISEERYHKMVEEVQDYAIILLDPEGNIQNWNAGAQKIKGYQANEVIGKYFSLFYTPPDQAQGLPQQLLREAATFGKAVHEGWRVTKHQTKFWGSIVITALHDQDGAIIGFSKVTRDLTDKKKADDQLKEYLIQLEKQNLELGQFAFAASHDLQEPLRKIMIFADLIERRLQDPVHTTTYARKISASAQRMSELIRGVLDFSRLGQEGSPKVATDLAVVLSLVLADFELQLQEKKAQVFSKDLPVIPAIPMQITQLFSNLISNALKFNDRHPLITISASRVERCQVLQPPASATHEFYLEIIFADNGIGFDQKYEQLIFNMFQRLNGKQPYPGTGIGLALCKKVMDNHDGWMVAKGNPGIGATFYLYFPSVQ